MNHRIFLRTDKRIVELYPTDHPKAGLIMTVHGEYHSVNRAKAESRYLQAQGYIVAVH